MIIADLIEALENQKIIGACLDVLEFESISFEEFSYADNPKFKSLVKFKNVLLTPHIAGWTVESKEKMAQVILNKIQDKFIT